MHGIDTVSPNVVGKGMIGKGIVVGGSAIESGSKLSNAAKIVGSIINIADKSNQLFQTVLCSFSS